MTQTYKVQVSMNQAHIVESGFVWKQGDFGFNIEIEVMDFDTTGATPQIIFRKSTGAVEATQITRAGNKFTYVIRGTELDTPGPCVCDLKLKDSTTKRVSTASFKYFVIPDTMDGLNQQASSYSDTIEQIINGYENDVEVLEKDINYVKNKADALVVELYNQNSFTSGDELFNAKKNPDLKPGTKVELIIDIQDNSVTYIEYFSETGSLGYYGRTSWGVSQKYFDIITTLPDNFYRALIRSNSSDTSNVTIKCFAISTDILDNKIDEVTETVYNYQAELCNNNPYASGNDLFSVVNKNVKPGNKVELLIDINDTSVTYIQFKDYNGAVLSTFGRSSSGVNQYHFDIKTTIPDKFYKAQFYSNSSDTSNISVRCYALPEEQSSNKLDELYNSLGIKKFNLSSANIVANASATNAMFINGKTNFSFKPAVETNHSGVYLNNAPLSAGKKYIISFDVSSSDTTEFKLTTRLGNKMVKGSAHLKGYYTPPSNLVLIFYCYIYAAATITISNLSVVEIVNPFGFDLLDSVAFDHRTLSAEHSVLDTMIPEINDLKAKVSRAANKNTVICACVTDTHYEEKVKDTSLYKLEMLLAEKLGVDFFMHMGDMVNEPAITGDPADIDINRRRFEDVMSAYRNSYIPFLYSIGHHELYPYNGMVDDYSSYGFTQSRAMGLGLRFNRSISLVKQSDGYSYYFDFADQKIRFISLDSVSDTAMGFAQSVLDWTENIALGTLPEGYGVVFFAHCPTDSSLIEGNPEVVNGSEMESIINTFIENGGKCYGYIHGHTHFDNIAKRGNIIEIAVTTEQDTIGNTLTGTFAGCPIRYTGRRWNYKTVFSIDFIVFDSDDETIKLYRFGVGKDRIITQSITPVECTISSGNSIDLSEIVKPFNSSDTVTWTSSDAGVATVTSAGIVTGVGSGDCIITAKGLYNNAICKITVS